MSIPEIFVLVPAGRHFSKEKGGTGAGSRFFFPCILVRNSCGSPQETEKYLAPPPREQDNKILRGKLLLHPPPTVDMENAVKTRKTISTIAILWPVKAIFEKSPLRWRWIL